VEAPALVCALEDNELRASDADFRVAGPVLEDATEIEAGRELPESEGNSLCLPMLGHWLAALRASDAGCRIVGCGEVSETCVGPLSDGAAGDVGPLFRLLELTLAGGAARVLREAAVFVLVVRDLATLAPSLLSPSSDLTTEFNARPAELTLECASALPAFKQNPSIDESSWSSWRGAVMP
jgi:hypothetical protein